VLTVIPGLAHDFKNDRGAESIAGLKLEAQCEAGIGVFAWLGASQIRWGLLLRAVALQSTMLVPLHLLLTVLQRSRLLPRWWARNGMVRHRPPEHYASLALLPFGVFLMFKARTRKV